MAGNVFWEHRLPNNLPPGVYPVQCKYEVTRAGDINITLDPPTEHSDDCALGIGGGCDCYMQMFTIDEDKSNLT
jgi:hypothetical protein